MFSRLLLCGLACLVIPAHAEPVFRAGVSAVDVSPKTFPRIIAGGFLEGRGERNVDALHVRSFVLDDGKMKIAFAIVDTCMMEQALIDEAKEMASQQCGIPVDRMMVSATHTHSAPAAMSCLGTRKDTEYAKFLTPKIAEAIVAADKALQPARIGWGSFDDWEHIHNRRWIRREGREVVDPFGQPTGRANMHPGYLSKDVIGPSGPVDPQFSVISLQTIDGKPLGVLANYSQHYFGSGAVSADYYGHFCRHLAAKMGQAGDGNGPFVCAMSQGTSGDLMWMDYGAEKKSPALDTYATEVADSAMKALATVKHHDHAPLGMVEKMVELKYRVPDKKRLQWARPIAAKIENDLPKNKEEVYAREALILHERQKTSLKLQAIRIGDLSIATLPNEVYAITGLKLREASPFPMHFNIELANGAEGYIPPPEQHQLGGYTTWPARTAGLDVNAETQMYHQLGYELMVLGKTFVRNKAGSDLGVYGREIADSKPSAHYDCSESDGELLRSPTTPIQSLRSDTWNVGMQWVGGHALYLPGVGSGLGYGEESALRLSPFSKGLSFNRSIQAAGGHLKAEWGEQPATPTKEAPSAASIALWFWLGHESGASERDGELIHGLGVALKAHQFTDHTVKLELAGAEGKVVQGFSPAGAASSDNEDVASKTGDHGLKPMSTLADDWHFVVLIRDGENVRVHLDGGEKPVLMSKAGKATNEVLFGQGLEGRLDEITVWNRAVETSLIAKLWDTSKVAEDNARRDVARKEKAKRVEMQTNSLLKQHENWSVAMRFRNTKANDARAVTAYLVSRGPKGDSQAPGDHLGIGGNYKDSRPGKLFVYNGNAANQTLFGLTTIQPGTWNEVKMERAGSRVKVTLNGKVEIDAELPVTALGSKEVFLGRRCDDFAPLDGMFENVKVSGLESREVRGVDSKNAGGTPAPHSAPLSPEESAKRWHVREGYEIELVAAEPVVLDPVAFDWDEKGRLWVVEMADYPLGMDGNGKAGGRVVMLEDSDTDGRYDRRTVIAQELSFPTGILTWRDGVIVTAAPDIFFISPDGTKKVLLTGFSTGNQQLRVNGLRWGMDGWVYCAAGAHNGGYNKGTQIESRLTGEKIDLGSRDFRFKPDTGEFDPQSGPSQFGRARDDWGHWFGVQNSFPLWHYVLQDHYLRRNPHVIPPDPIHQLYPRNPPVYPASGLEKRFHSFDQAGRFTSACGIEVYRDRVLFDDGKTHAFTCEPFHNVVQHHVLEDDGVTFKARVDVNLGSSTEPRGDSRTTDFLASEDRWCRPVMVRTGPDGALWVADMYRYMIEHPQWLPQNGKDELLPHYREGDDKGRIWRVVKKVAGQSTSPALRHGDGLKPITTFASANGWCRDRAQMMALWDGFEAKQLVQLLQNPLPQVRAQTAWTFLLGGKTDFVPFDKLLSDPAPEVRVQALQMHEKFDHAPQSLMGLYHHDWRQLADPRVSMQLALSAGHWKDEWLGDVLAEILEEYPQGSEIVGAALSSVLPHLERACTRADKRSAPMLFRCALTVKNEKAMAALIARTQDQRDMKELLAVLDEHELSLAQFTKEMRSPDAQQGLKKMGAILAKAVQAVQASADSPTMDDLMLLASDREHRGMVKGMLGGLWAKTGSAEVLKLISKLQPKGAPEFLLERFDERTPAMRGQIIEALLSNDEWTTVLLGRAEAKSCDAATRARLVKHPKKEIAKLAGATFADSASATRAAAVERFRPALKLTGDAEKGKATFAMVCASCHKLDGVGMELGPDLRSVVQHDAEKLMNSILDPSAIIEPGFMAYHCTLKSGEQLYGVVATETSASLTLKMAGNITRSVLRSDVTSLKSTNTSLMPEGLEAALTPQALADLIAYLKMAR
ncbi:PVC-type heme-binding CxxCH protein [Brevifollis gellanilyticus]|nr:PVC-type heme-binding CxxCH protein [Brevifollis gellanilyticus]